MLFQLACAIVIAAHEAELRTHADWTRRARLRDRYVSEDKGERFLAEMFLRES